MLVKHLIRELQKCDPDAEVCMETLRSGEYKEERNSVNEDLTTFRVRKSYSLNRVMIVDYEAGPFNYYYPCGYSNKQDTPRPLPEIEE